MKLKKERILVIGSGSWGTAISNLIAKNSYQVFLSSNHQEIISEINSHNTNHHFLPEVKLSPSIRAVEDFASLEVKALDLVFIVVPSDKSKPVFEKIAKIKSQFSEKCGFVICSKGFELQSKMLLSDAFEAITGIKNYAVLSGPNFALEVANECPTVSTIASRSKKLANRIAKVLNNNYFQAHYFKDPRTAEICGIVKNVIAIGCGLIDGFAFGVNTKSALVVKGIEEIRILCKKFKASDDLDHAAGFGDLFLTCSSEKSRNNSLGRLIASGKIYQQILLESKKTYEGAFSVQSLHFLEKDLCLCGVIYRSLFEGLSIEQIKKELIEAVLS